MKKSDLQSALESCTLKEAIINKHGRNGPSTYRRNNNRKPIDGIWTSPSIEILAGGYFDYDEVFLNSDHRCLWIDLTYKSVFGHGSPIITKRARRLHCKDPRIVDNYVRSYRKYILKNNLPGKVRRLKDKASYPLSEADQRYFEDLDDLRCKGVQQAEKKCRKLRMGQVPFSPQLQQASRIIDVWVLIRKKAKGLKTSSRLLQRAIKKLSLPKDSQGLPLEDIEQKLKLAYQEYYKVKGLVEN
jgi:hypothetical protein